MTDITEPLHAEAVAGLDPDEPVVMLNLMRFREASLDGNGTGWDAYLRYSALTMPLIKARHGTIIWAGEVGPVALGVDANGNWDYAALVRYPSPAAFLDMMASAEYATANVERENGTVRHLILATHTKYSKMAGGGA